MYRTSRPSLTETVKSRTPSAPACVEASRAMTVMSSSALVPRMITEVGCTIVMASMWSKLTRSVGGVAEHEAALVDFRTRLEQDRVAVGEDDDAVAGAGADRIAAVDEHAGSGPGR